MKTIISPTDYSENAWNATEYAANLAREMSARLVLFHAFDVPVITTDALIDLPSVSELTTYHQNRLEEQKNLLVHTYGIEVSCVVKVGPVVAQLRTFFAEQYADLVVMGLRGTNPLKHLLIGSVVVSLLRKAKLPILVVPRGYSFHPIRRILFACDLEPVEGSRILAPLKEIARTFKAMIEVLHMDVATQPAHPHSTHWESELSSLKHGYTFLYQEDIYKGIDQSVQESKADLLVMIPHKHTFFEQLLDKSNTQKMIFHSTVPLLALAVMEPA